MLIGDEPEQGMENLMEVEIPQDVEKKLTEADNQEQQELKEEEEKMRQEEKEKIVKGEINNRKPDWYKSVTPVA